MGFVRIAERKLCSTGLLIQEQVSRVESRKTLHAFSASDQQNVANYRLH